ncbi:MAG: phosphonate ABC transporter, permease protein PhnE [Syntrophorhabdaceae bacterium]|nr:phosphonate ABC transporter, permease protein PhnE [Syntrophorhabdaceae bacterium]
MHLEEIRRKTNPFSPYKIIILFLFLALFTWSWKTTEMSVGALIKGWENMIVYLRGNPSIEGSSFIPPAIDVKTIKQYLLSMVETVHMAIIALVISVVIAFPFAFFASRNTLDIMMPKQTVFFRTIKKIIYTTTRFFANLSRSINEVVWALIFVSAVGLGPMAGILALGVHTSGVLIKLFSEGIEAIDSEPVNALASTGAHFIKIIRYAIIPQIMPFFVSMTLYRFESDVRSATILGITGAGGIGVYLYDRLRGYDNHHVTTILIIIVVTVAIVDRISAMIRKRFT